LASGKGEGFRQRGCLDGSLRLARPARTRARLIPQGRASDVVHDLTAWKSPEGAFSGRMRGYFASSVDEQVDEQGPGRFGMRQTGSKQSRRRVTAAAGPATSTPAFVPPTATHPSFLNSASGRRPSSLQNVSSNRSAPVLPPQHLLLSSTAAHSPRPQLRARPQPLHLPSLRSS
jgi:hypothetical protein